MKQVVCIAVALLLLLAGCSSAEPTSTPASEPEGIYTHDIYELTFAVESISGEPVSDWGFTYSHDGEIIASGYQTLLSVEVFTFYSVQVIVAEKGNASNTYSASMPVALCDGGSGKTEITVTASDGKVSTFRVICTVQRIGRS